MRDVVPAEYMGPGAFRYVIDVKGSSGVAGRAERAFEVQAAPLAGRLRSE